MSLSAGQAVDVPMKLSHPQPLSSFRSNCIITNLVLTKDFQKHSSVSTFPITILLKSILRYFPNRNKMTGSEDSFEAEYQELKGPNWKAATHPQYIKPLAGILARECNGLRWRIWHSLQTILFSHGLGALKLVWQPAPFQFPGMGLGSKGVASLEVFTHTCKMKAGHPEMIAHVDSFTGSYLEFPLETKMGSKTSCSPQPRS